MAILSQNTRFLLRRSINDQIRRMRQLYLRVFPEHGVLPDFLIIGAARCGTTSLYNYLGEHSHIRLAARKEIGYFRTGSASGSLDRYKAHFPLAIGERDWITGEAYPSYIFDPESPRKVFETLPHVRMVVLMRDPVDRAQSAYNYNRERGVEPAGTFEEALALEAERIDRAEAQMKGKPGLYAKAFHRFAYVEEGQYAEQIERWLEFFPREQFYFTSSERFFKDVKKTLREMVAFLGLEDEGIDGREVFGKRDYQPMSDETRQQLVAHFRPHNEHLYKLLGTDYGWKR
jgi:hypothetical protein